MRRLIMFIFGLLLLALIVAMLFLTSAIYDTGIKESINTHFFQTNELSVMRPGAPIHESEIGETAMREMLIKKYVTEYFYAIPDMDNIKTRMSNNSTMAIMSSAKVFNNWRTGEAQGIQSMAENQMMRTVEIAGEIHKPNDSDYWVVPYILKTWTVSNDMAHTPQITRGTLLMEILYEPGVREIIGNRPFDVGKFLKDSYNSFENRYDPAVIFRFQVSDLEQQ